MKRPSSLFATILIICLAFLTFAQDTPALPRSPHSETDTLPGISVKVQAGSLTATGATLQISNSSDAPLTFGLRYLLETRVGSRWYTLPMTETDPAWDDLGYEVAPGSALTLGPTDWKGLYGALPSGEYRILKEGVAGTANDLSRHWFAAPFTLTDRQQTSHTLAAQYDPAATNTLPGVTLQVESVSGSGMVVTAHNRSHTDLAFDNLFALERRYGKMWLPLPYQIDGDVPTWTEGGLSLQGGSCHTFDRIDWEWLYGPLPAGKYRLVKEGVAGTGSDVTSHWFAAYFVV